VTIVDPTPARTHRRTRRRTSGVLVGLLVVAPLVVLGCTASEDDAEEAPDPSATASSPPTGAPSELCVRFPRREATAPFDAITDPALAGDPAAADRLLEMAANGLTSAAPEGIRPAVETYEAALRDYEPGTDPLASASTQAAVDELDAWLRTNCGPPPATTP